MHARGPLLVVARHRIRAESNQFTNDGIPPTDDSGDQGGATIATGVVRIGAPRE